MDFLTISFLFCSCVLLQVAYPTIAQPDFKHFTCYGESGFYAANSTYKRNLDTLLSSIASNNESDRGFYNLSVGKPPNQVNAIAFCRGDVGSDDCRSCVVNSTRKILEICPNQTDAIGVYDFCRLRYNNRSIYGVIDMSRIFSVWNSNNASNMNRYNQAQQTLFHRLRRQTADSIRKFATGKETAGFQRVFALMQCSPDLSSDACNNCLVQVISYVGKSFAGKTAASSMTPSCDVMFDNKIFYNPDVPAGRLAAPPPPQASPSPDPPLPDQSFTQGQKSNLAKMIVITVVPTASTVIIFFVCFCIVFRRQRAKEKTEIVDKRESPETLQLDLSNVRLATDNFCEKNKLGQGGFGAVYKGRLLSNGQKIAVKRLSTNSGQGDLEFKNEVLFLAKLQHRNLVKLLGFCLEGKERLLIYEFVPNASLDRFIFDQVKRTLLDWMRRYNIIHGIARGLLYLHQDSSIRLIHRDLKASNILLDKDMNPKISDFGMARLMMVDQTQVNTKRIVGTYGYIAPEYVKYGQFSVKSDVFSFGVMLLEIISGQKNSCIESEENTEYLLTYAWRNWKKGTYKNLIDPTLRNGSRKEIRRCIHIGLLCVQENKADRPTMASVILMLSSHSISLTVPSRPAFYIRRRYESDTSSSQSGNETLPPTINEASLSELHPR